MLTITTRQLDLLEDSQEAAFIRRATDDLRSFAPELTSIAGEDNLKKLVRIGMDGSARHAFTKRGPTLFFLELMASFGMGFDSDPLLPWANDTLRKTTGQIEMSRADSLFEAMNGYIEAVIGKDNAILIRAARSAPSHFARLPALLQQGRYEDKILDALQDAYPEKALYAGEQQLRILIADAAEQARLYGVNHPIAYGIMTALMFSFGHRVHLDPLYPWIHRTLSDPAVPNQADRFKRVFHKASNYIAHLAAALG